MPNYVLDAILVGTVIAGIVQLLATAVKIPGEFRASRIAGKEMVEALKRLDEQRKEFDRMI